MNRKITLAASIFLGVITSVIADAERQTMPLPIPGHSTQVSIKQNITKLSHVISSDKINSIIAVLKEHPYKSLIGAMGLVGTAYLAYNKYQVTKLQAELLKILEETHNIIVETVNKVQGTTNFTDEDETIIEPYKGIILPQQKRKMQALLSQYNTRIKRTALLAQDKNGNTILHNDTKELSLKCQKKRIEKNKENKTFSAEGENVASLYYFEQIISTLINQCNNIATKDRLLATTNHGKEPLFITLADYYKPRGGNFPKLLHLYCQLSEKKYFKIYNDFNLKRNFPKTYPGK
ncbi:TPA: hypothetical protein DCW54_03210 [Candidatus Dependentiae bacterium]|nr:hypothetical protein [Candidatus Dependentiae bacterium]